MLKLFLSIELDDNDENSNLKEHLLKEEEVDKQQDHETQKETNEDTSSPKDTKKSGKSFSDKIPF